MIKAFIFFMLCIGCISAKAEKRNYQDSVVEYISYCVTEKKDLCNWTPYLAIAQNDARIHHAEFENHETKIYRRVYWPERNIKRNIKITELKLDQGKIKKAPVKINPHN